MKRFIFIFLLFISFCSKEGYKVEEEKKIKTMLEKYYKFLSLSYIRQDPKLLWPVATEHEIKQTERTMANMWGEGYHIEPYLLNFEIKYLDIYQINNAYLKTYEIWAVSYYDYKTRKKITEDFSQTLNVIYQLKKVEGFWKVTSRVPEETMIKIIP